MTHSKRGFIFVLLFLCYTSLHAQIKIKGTVTDAETGEPLPGVNVYLANSTIGSSTNAEGHYEINNITSGIYEIVFSSVGYNEHVKGIELKERSSPIKLDVSLKPKVYEVREAEVVSSNKEWKKDYSIFEKEFIGETPFAENTTINNPWIIDFDKGENNTLTASAEEPLIVINESLGYRVYIELVAFKWSRRSREAAYKTYSKYEPIKAKTPQQQEKWEQNRIKTYLGSFTHFLKTLYNNELDKSDFSVRWASDISTLKAGATRFKLFQNGLSLSMLEEFKGYNLDNEVHVSFSKSYSYQASDRKKELSIRKKNSLSPNTEEEAFFVHQKGTLLNPASVKVFGHWAKTRIADSLPSNYRIGN